MNKEDKRLFLLDAFALIYRAYFAFIRNPITTSKGVNVSAVYGFTNALFDLISKQNPTHLAVVFDSADETTERAQEFEFYKANRDKMPEDIEQAIPIIKEIIKGFHVPILEVPGFEADDIIGTLAKAKEKEGYKVFMVTPDKDFAQLVSENIFIYKPGRQGGPDEILGVPEIKEKWEVNDPLQVIDILGMWGDAVDNIPGIPGIGEKTAKKLIKEFGSLEGLLENTDKLKGKQKENVENYAEQGIISKKLATIILDVPFNVTNRQLLIDEPDREKLSELFRELEFKTLGKRILGEEYKVNVASTEGAQIDLFAGEADDEEIIERGKNISNTKHKYVAVIEDKEIEKLLIKLNKAKVVCLDTETTSLDTLDAEIVGMSFSTKSGEAFYVPIDANQKKAQYEIEAFKPFFENENILKVGQNIKYDLSVLKNYNIELKGPMFDTMLAHYLTDAESRHGMDFLAESMLGYTPISTEELIGKKGKNQLNMRDVSLEQITEYAAEDADITFQLYEKLQPKIKDIKAEKLLRDLECPLSVVLSEMEREGIALDKSFLEKYSVELGKSIDDLKIQIFELAGESFNLDSPKQMGETLFGKLEINYSGKKTKTGQYSTNEDTLSRLEGDHEIINHILKYRTLNKLKSTYVDALPSLVHPRTSRIHTTFNQAIAATGRLSSINPNLQNIPIRTEEGRKIRKAFIPRDNKHVLLSADYSQIELRLVAEISGDKNMRDAFINGQDIHATTAAKVYGVSLDDVTREMRGNAKMVNFGIIYAISAFGLSQRLRIPRKDAAELIENYFQQYPKVKEYMQSTVESARKNGYVETILGRRRYLANINSRNHPLRTAAEREAINSPIQGSAADLIKVAMIDIQQVIKDRKLKSAMILQVHDELVFDVYSPDLEEITSLVVQKMENAIPNLKVPIKVDTGTGKNWLQAH